jgi:hypothetical protein
VRAVIASPSTAIEDFDRFRHSSVATRSHIVILYE